MYSGTVVSFTYYNRSRHDDGNYTQWRNYEICAFRHKVFELLITSNITENETIHSAFDRKARRIIPRMSRVSSSRYAAGIVQFSRIEFRSFRAAERGLVRLG